MILDRFVKVKKRKTTEAWYKSKGYDTSCKEFVVDVKDLYIGATVKVKCQCDFCNKIFYRKASKVCFKTIHSCNDKKCKNELRKLTCLEKFGVENVNKCKEIKQKSSDTFKKRYGKDSPIHEEFINKRKATNKEKYGNEGGYRHEISSKIRSKIVNTMINNYLNARCRKGGKKVIASAMQVHVCELLDGILNYELNGKFIDIALIDCKIAIEYDGGGHSYWNQVHGNFDSIRDEEFFKLGWKMIRIKNNRDCIFPNDDQLLKLINYCKDKLTNCDLITINFVDRTITSNKFTIKIDSVLG